MEGQPTLMVPVPFHMLKSAARSALIVASDFSEVLNVGNACVGTAKYCVAGDCVAGPRMDDAMTEGTMMAVDFAAPAGYVLL